jgi:hypothetical protein
MKPELAAKIMAAAKEYKRIYLEECGIKGKNESVLYLRIVAHDDSVISLRME